MASGLGLYDLEQALRPEWRESPDFDPAVLDILGSSLARSHRDPA